MKKLLAIASIAVTGLIAFPETAEAGHPQVSVTYRSGHSACGCPMYTKRYFSGYDCYRRPVYRYAYVPVVHRCRSHARPPVHYRHGRYYGNSCNVRPVHRPVHRAVPAPGYRRGYQGGRYHAGR